MKPLTVQSVLCNWRSGCTGMAVFLLLWGALFFLAFMIAFGNNTPALTAILHAIGFLLTIANPLWGIPAAYIFGAFFIRR
jgi:hypothetical protein